MSEQNNQTNERDFSIDEVELPIKRVTGDTVEEVLTSNAYNNILPARYLKKDEHGNVIETPEELFDRVASNVALADAVFHANDAGFTIEATPLDIKPEANVNRRRDLCDEVFGPGVGLEDESATVEVDDSNIVAFAYSTIIPKLPEEIQETVRETRDEFYEEMTTLGFMPNSPTLMNAGDEFQQLSACFVDSPEDDIDDIHQTVKEAAKIFQSGGGLGYAFSRLRPYGDRVGSSGGISSGPISFMRTFDQMCETIAQGGKRRGAQMAILSVDHPDIVQFIHAKNKDVSLAHSLRLNDPDDFTHNSFGEALEEARELIETDENGTERVPKHLRNASEGHLSNFNISLGVTDAFMEAVKNDEEYELINPRTDEQYIANSETKDLYSWFGLGEYVEVGEPLAIPAREIWKRVVEGAHGNGEPGMIFMDRVNKMHSFDIDEHPEHEILATNPCVAEGTLVNTPEGYVSVENVDIGDEISTVIGSETVDEIEVHEDYEVYRVKFSDGSYLDVTEEHRFNILNGKEVLDDIPLRKLDEGDMVRLESTPIRQEGDGEEYRQKLKQGILLGDGCYSPKTLDRHNIVKIASSTDDSGYNDNIKTLFINQEFRKDDVSKKSKSMNMIMKNGQDIVNKFNLTPSKSYEKDFDVTKINTKQEAIGILDGLLATDGNINLNSNHPQIRWDTSSYEMAQSIRQTLLLLGCHGRISISKKANRGGTIDDRKITANYDKHTVNVSGDSARKYAEYTKISQTHPQKGDQMFELQTKWMTTGNTWKAKIDSIEPVDEKVTVYDLYCKTSDTWVTEGYVSRGCGEQPLEEYEACNLGHINLSTVVSTESPDWRVFKDEVDGSLEEQVDAFLDEAIDWDILNRRIERGTHFLENVVTMSDFPVEEITEKVDSNRKIGLGVMGLAQMYIQMGTKYGSDEANEIAKQVMQAINFGSKEVSHQIATGDNGFANRGSFGNWHKSKYANPTEYADWFTYHTGEDASDWEDGYPVRNHNTTTIAPTGTTSMLGDTSGGCEPIFQVAYYKNVTQDVQGEEMLVEFDDYFLRVLEANDIDVDAAKREAQEQMAANEFDGVDSLESVPDAIGELFIVTSDLSAEQHCKVQCASQKGVDSAISKTVNAPHDATVEDAQDAFMLAYDLGGKGVTYYRDGTRSKQVLTTRADNMEDADDDTLVEKVREKIDSGEIDPDELGISTVPNVGSSSQPKRRPKVLNGHTSEINTGYGDLLVTINETHKGEPFEVIANIGKSGGYTESFTESTARLISLCLRCGVDPDEVVGQIEGIRSPKISWDEGDQVFSVPDGISLALQRYLNDSGSRDIQVDDDDDGSSPVKVDDSTEPSDNNISSGQKDVIKGGENPECPSCGSLSLYYSEGCKTCESCGWSEC